MSETKEQEPLAAPPLLPSDGLPDVEPLSDDLAIAKRMKQKSRNDAHLTAGCGYTTRKAVLLKAFWEEMWPELEKIGWQKIEGVDENEGSIKFFPPSSDGKELAVLDKTGRRGKDYYDRIIDIIERVQMRRNGDEKKAADRFTRARQLEQKKRRSTRSRPGDGKKRKHTNASGASSTGSISSEDTPLVTLRRRQPSMVGATIDLSWKFGGALYPKHSSRIGNEYEAADIPAAGTYNEGSHSDLYELVYDPSNDNAAHVSNALNNEIPVNKKEQAFFKLGLMAMGSTNEIFSSDVAGVVNQLEVKDGSDWTREEKETFHREIFRLRKDLTALSKLMGKDLNTCYTYYLSTFKQSDDYRVLKVICEQERMDDIGTNGNSLDACAVCGDGGRLIICDGCEGEYHVGCLRPRLRTIPEGHWECDECVDRKLLKNLEHVISHTKLFESHQNDGAGDAHNASNGGDAAAGDRTVSGDITVRPSSPVLAAVKAFVAGIHEVFNKANLAAQKNETEAVPIPQEPINGADVASDKPAGDTEAGLDANDPEFPTQTPKAAPIPQEPINSADAASDKPTGDTEAGLDAHENDPEFPTQTPEIQPGIENPVNLI